MKYRCYLLFGLISLLFFSCKKQQEVQAFSKLIDANWELFSGSESTGFNNITRYPSGDRFPDISATGEIVFCSDRKGSFNLYIMEHSGENLRPLSHSPFPDVRPRWSPDGRFILFVSERNERNENLFLLDMQNANQQKKTPNPLPLTEHLGADYEAAWHPNGEQVVFVSEREHSSYKAAPEIYLLHLQSKKQERLTQNTLPKHTPAFSSTGKQLAFSQFEKGQWQLVWGTLAEIQKEEYQRFVPVPSKAKDFGLITDVRWHGDDTLLYTQVQGESSSSMTFNIKTRHGESFKQEVRERVSKVVR